MIIIEGPDCAGKTTLAKVAFHDFTYQHQGPYWRDAFVETVLTTSRVGSNTVWDRLHLGERVYGPIYRGKDKLDAVGQRLTERYLLSRRAAVIAAVPPWGFVRDAFTERRQLEMFGGDDDWETNLRQQWERFSAILASTMLPSTTWDYTVDNARTLRELVLSLRPRSGHGLPGIGDPTPGGILLVGERPSKARATQGTDLYRLENLGDGYPFLHRRGCSGWLAERLNDAGISERGLYWVNALQRDGQLTAPDFVDSLEPRRIIALGGGAKMWCQLHKLAHRRVPHPQYWKRFHHHEPYPLLALLKDA